MEHGTGARKATTWQKTKERAAGAWWRVPRWLQVLVVCVAVLAVARLVAEILQG